MGNQAPSFRAQLLILFLVLTGNLAFGENGLNSLDGLPLEGMRRMWGELASNCTPPIVCTPGVPPLPLRQFNENSKDIDSTSPPSNPQPPGPSQRGKSPMDLQPPEVPLLYYSTNRKSQSPVDPKPLVFRHEAVQQNPGVPLSFDRTAWGTDPPSLDARPVNPAGSGMQLSFDQSAWGTDPRPTQPSIGLQAPHYGANMDSPYPIDPILSAFRLQNQPGANPRYRQSWIDDPDRKSMNDKAGDKPWGTDLQGPPLDIRYKYKSLLNDQMLIQQHGDGFQGGQRSGDRFPERTLKSGLNSARRTTGRSVSNSNDKDPSKSDNWTDGLWQMLLLNLLHNQMAN